MDIKRTMRNRFDIFCRMSPCLLLKEEMLAMLHLKYYHTCKKDFYFNDILQFLDQRSSTTQSVCMCVCLYVCMSVCLKSILCPEFLAKRFSTTQSVFISVYLYVFLSICLSVCSLCIYVYLSLITVCLFVY